MVCAREGLEQRVEENKNFGLEISNHCVKTRMRVFSLHEGGWTPSVPGAVLETVGQDWGALW
ncbi:hypothetical protein E2C01_016796 [Portunus trituberculatus]|uniref:Uncharacterized protein n=1 Tax=Portunus trituberculatus TaxID=210409 RepID=A0A5B7DR74_PORTR|nr:hypothetical protein [Portunus trituberculatus]